MKPLPPVVMFIEVYVFLAADVQVKLLTLEVQKHAHEMKDF